MSPAEAEHCDTVSLLQPSATSVLMIYLMSWLLPFCVFWWWFYCLKMAPMGSAEMWSNIRKHRKLHRESSCYVASLIPTTTGGLLRVRLSQKKQNNFTTNSTFIVTLDAIKLPWMEKVVYLCICIIPPPQPQDWEQQWCSELGLQICSRTTDLRMLLDTLDLKKYATGFCPQKGYATIYTVLKENWPQQL